VRGEVDDSVTAGAVIALAYPDRVARRRGRSTRYLLANGTGAEVAAGDPLAKAEWLAVAEVDRVGAAADARIFLAGALDAGHVERLFASHMTTTESAEWDVRNQDVNVAAVRKLGAIEITRSPIDDPNAASRALLTGIAREGLALLPRASEARSLRTRVAFCRSVFGDEWPDFSDDALLAALDEWLLPFLGGARRRADLARVDVVSALRARLPAALSRQLDVLAPTHIEVPSGSRIAVDYETSPPRLPVRVQEVFGWPANPMIAGGTVPVVLELLSPAHRPIQTTADLGGFWRGSYADVRRELRGRYPKHEWPEDPLHATPKRRPGKRSTGS
jgi:ATP-dependent helicase HrpB